MKVAIPIEKGNQLINTGCVILVTSTDQEKPNIITLAWQMPVSYDPPLVAISVAKNHYSHNLIENSLEFAINIPSFSLLDKVWYCGRVSGRKADKFKETGLTPLPAAKIKSPLIGECIGHLECKAKQTYPAGDHSIFIGEVVNAMAEKELFDEFWKIEKEVAKTLHHLGGERFTIPEKEIKAK